jgi:hypothetical protein
MRHNVILMSVYYYLPLLIILIAFYIPPLRSGVRFRERKGIRIEFFRAVLHELDTVQNDDDVLNRIRGCYEDVRYRYAAVGGIFTSLGDALGLFYNRFIQRGKKDFGKSYPLVVEQKHLDRIQALRNILRSQDPFADVSPKFQNLLHSAHRFYELGNVTHGLVELGKLEQMIKESENEARQRRDENHKAYLIAVTGVILTLIFGLAPLVLGKANNGSGKGEVAPTESVNSHSVPALEKH